MQQQYLLFSQHNRKHNDIVLKMRYDVGFGVYVFGVLKRDKTECRLFEMSNIFIVALFHTTVFVSNTISKNFYLKHF